VRDVITLADLTRANLEGANLPDGRTFAAWLVDPLADICAEPEARKRAVAAWGNHTWADCPMHAAYGWGGVEDVPKKIRTRVATFVALFDGKHLPPPTP